MKEDEISGRFSQMDGYAEWRKERDKVASTEPKNEHNMNKKLSLELCPPGYYFVSGYAYRVHKGRNKGNVIYVSRHCVKNRRK